MPSRSSSGAICFTANKTREKIHFRKMIKVSENEKFCLRFLKIHLFGHRDFLTAGPQCLECVEVLCSAFVPSSRQIVLILDYSHQWRLTVMLSGGRRKTKEMNSKESDK